MRQRQLSKAVAQFKLCVEEEASVYSGSMSPSLCVPRGAASMQCHFPRTSRHPQWMRWVGGTLPVTGHASSGYAGSPDVMCLRHTGSVFSSVSR